MLLMALTAMVIYWLLQRYGPRGAPLIFALYIFIGACALAQMRYDLLPAMMTLLCVIAAERKHWTAAYVALAFGVLLKIYPIMLLPPLFIAEQQAKGRLGIPSRVHSLGELSEQLLRALRGARNWQWKNCAIFLAFVLGVTGIFALFDFNSAVLSQFNYFMHRPIQVESIAGTVLWMARELGVPWQGISSGFGSINILSGLSGFVSALGTLCCMLGYVYVLWLQWHRKIDMAQTAIALTLVFIATGKVFSPQYLIWVIPLLAYTGSFDAFWIVFWGAISLQTTIIYAFFNSRINVVDTQIITMPSGFFEIVGLRNVFFVLLTLAYLFNWFQARQRRPLVERRGERWRRELPSFSDDPESTLATTASEERGTPVLTR
jgi:hypothetical protein